MTFLLLYTLCSAFELLFSQSVLPVSFLNMPTGILCGPSPCQDPTFARPLCSRPGPFPVLHIPCARLTPSCLKEKEASCSAGSINIAPCPTAACGCGKMRFAVHKNSSNNTDTFEDLTINGGISAPSDERYF